jgi:histone acetyltransferase
MVQGGQYKPTEIFGGEALRCLHRFSVDLLEKEASQMALTTESLIPMFCKDLDKALSDRHSLIYAKNFDQIYKESKVDEDDYDELEGDTDEDEGKIEEAHSLKQKYDAFKIGDSKRIRLGGQANEDIEMEDQYDLESEDSSRTGISRTTSDLISYANGYEPSDTCEMTIIQEDQLVIEKPLSDFYQTGLASAVKREEKARQEEKEHKIQFRLVMNDGKRDCYVILTGLKNIFMKQLPEMPKEYITRLVYDKNHLSLALLKEGLNVIGGITYRLFLPQKLAEIVFCAISSDEQVKGYGSLLMSHLKDLITSFGQELNYILTYADNYAIGYFRKQGFTTEITLERHQWAGYIKDYDGGTLMQCSLVPKMKYLQIPDIIQRQKLAVWQKIKEQTNAHVIYPGLTIFKEGKITSIPVDQIPGVIEAHWTPDMSNVGEQKRINLSSLMRTLLSEVQVRISTQHYT